MSAHGLEPLSLFLILCCVLWNACEFRALFEISGSYELGAPLWGTEQYNKGAALKTNHCSWPLSMLCDTDFSGVFCGMGVSHQHNALGFNFGLESWEGPRKISLSISLKELA